MREIKFRVRNKNNGQLLYFTLQRIVGYQYFGDNLDWDNAEEYTGLKDKHNVEIYEGDIIKTKDTYGYEKWQYSVVEYKHGYFHMRCVNYKTGYLGIENLSYCGNEVIGNIYENKELLK